MSDTITITTTIRLDEIETDPATLAETARAAILDRIAHGIFGAGDTIDSYTVSSEVGGGLLGTLSRMQTWEETCRLAAIDEGLRSEEDIAAHTASAQTDLEYLVGQDDALESAIATARDVTGYTPAPLAIPDDGTAPEM